MLRVLDIDIPDMSRRGICNDALYVYDDETIFTRAMVSVFLCVCFFLMWDIQITPNTLVINEIPCHSCHTCYYIMCADATLLHISKTC